MSTRLRTRFASKIEPRAPTGAPNEPGVNIPDSHYEGTLSDERAKSSDVNTTGNYTGLLRLLRNL